MKRYLILLACTLLLSMPNQALAQVKVTVNLAPVDGLDLNPDNLFNFQVVCHMAQSTRALVKGTIVYRKSGLRLHYEFQQTLQPGLNTFSGKVKPVIHYSSPGLKDLFELHKKLPQGIYEYCVTVVPDYRSVEGDNETYNECTYHKSEDLFLINLVDPENKAEIYETNPMLSWVVNYPFAAELQYRIRVAPIKDGQTAITAISRNNPVYDERNLMQLSMMYPVYGKPLEKFQPYAWTVDAYYKGILLGGAEPWQFTIIEDSLFTAIPRDPAFVDIKKENGSYNLYAPGKLKLKYKLDDLRADTLRLQLLDEQEQPVKIRETFLAAQYGDNRFELDFHESGQPLRHLKRYTLLLTSIDNHTYRILFRYANPELIR
jgi:hypothetical protein